MDQLYIAKLQLAEIQSLPANRSGAFDFMFFVIPDKIVAVLSLKHPIYSRRHICKMLSFEPYHFHSVHDVRNCSFSCTRCERASYGAETANFEN